MNPTVNDLIPADTFDAVTATVRDNNPGMQPDLAERIVTEALKFVATAARFPRHGIAPSPVVDEGWHALILHTNAYADLCERLGAGFIHHQAERPDPQRQDPLVLTRTVVLMDEAGYPADQFLWANPVGDFAANCQHTPKCKVCWNPPPKPPAVLA